jgi:hypothetical protein
VGEGLGDDEVLRAQHGHLPLPHVGALAAGEHVVVELDRPGRGEDDVEVDLTEPQLGQPRALDGIDAEPGRDERLDGRRLVGAADEDIEVVGPRRAAVDDRRDAAHEEVRHAGVGERVA